MITHNDLCEETKNTCKNMNFTHFSRLFHRFSLVYNTKTNFLLYETLCTYPYTEKQEHRILSHIQVHRALFCRTISVTITTLLYGKCTRQRTSHKKRMWSVKIMKSMILKVNETREKLMFGPVLKDLRQIWTFPTQEAVRANVRKGSDQKYLRKVGEK